MALLERHEGAARASVARYYPGRDLNDVFTGSMTPDECWDLLMQLPRDSPLMSALADDDELAEPSAGPQLPRMADFPPEVEVLAAVHDLLASLLSAVSALGGGKVNVSPYPRPSTAAARARKREAKRIHEDLLRRLRIEV